MRGCARIGLSSCVHQSMVRLVSRYPSRSSSRSSRLCREGRSDRLSRDGRPRCSPSPRAAPRPLARRGAPGRGTPLAVPRGLCSDGGRDPTVEPADQIHLWKRARRSHTSCERVGQREGERGGRTPDKPLSERVGQRRGARSGWPRRRQRGARGVRQGFVRGSSGVRVASILLTSHSSPSAALRRVPSANLDGGLSGGMP